MGMPLTELKILSFKIVGGETSPPMKCKSCTTNTSFINNYFSFKFSNGLSYFFGAHYMCASVETHFFSAISEVDWGVPTSA